MIADMGTDMLQFIEGLPPDVMAVEAVGEVTNEDYRKTLIPKAEAMMTKGPIKMLYVIGKDFTGFSLEALWDDAAFGMKHWHDFNRIAIVADDNFLRAIVNMFRPFFHGDIRLFGLSELTAAKDWITNEVTND